MKRFLESNKVYFDIISSFLFGGAAILISIAAYNLSKKQLDNEVTPHFYSQVSYKATDGYYDGEILEIYNVGAPVYNVGIHSYNFIKISYKGEEINAPLVGYFPISVNSKNGEGLIHTYMGDKNNKKYFDLSMAVLEYDFSLELDKVFLLDIHYLDRGGNKVHEYYLNAEKVEEGVAKKYIHTYHKSMHIDINKVTKEDVFAIVASKPNKRLKGGAKCGAL